MIQIYGFQAMKRSKLQDMRVNRSWSVSPPLESKQDDTAKFSRLFNEMDAVKRDLKSTPWR